MHFELEIESKSGGIIMLVEIAYSIEQNQLCQLGKDNLYYRTPGCIFLEEVVVLALTGYDRDGGLVYDYEYQHMLEERLNIADQIAFSIVENDIIDNGKIYEALLLNAN